MYIVVASVACELFSHGSGVDFPRLLLQLGDHIKLRLIDSHLLNCGNELLPF
jgi:hypothetical protein